MDERKFLSWYQVDDAVLVRKTLIVMGLLVLAWLLWTLADILLLAFGAVLVAIILRALADVLVRTVRVPQRWSLMAASLLIFCVLLGLLALFGVQIRQQFSAVVERLPFAIDSFSRSLGLGPVTDDVSKILDEMSAGGLASRIAGIGGTVLGALGVEAMKVVHPRLG